MQLQELLAVKSLQNNGSIWNNLTKFNRICQVLQVNDIKVSNKKLC